MADEAVMIAESIQVRIEVKNGQAVARLVATDEASENLIKRLRQIEGEADKAGRALVDKLSNKADQATRGLDKLDPKVEELTSRVSALDGSLSVAGAAIQGALVDGPKGAARSIGTATASVGALAGGVGGDIAIVASFALEIAAASGVIDTLEENIRRVLTGLTTTQEEAQKAIGDLLAVTGVDGEFNIDSQDLDDLLLKATESRDLIDENRTFTEKWGNAIKLAFAPISPTLVAGLRAANSEQAEALQDARAGVDLIEEQIERRDQLFRAKEFLVSLGLEFNEDDPEAEAAKKAAERATDDLAKRKERLEKDIARLQLQNIVDNEARAIAAVQAQFDKFREEAESIGADSLLDQGRDLFEQRIEQIRNQFEARQQTLLAQVNTDLDKIASDRLDEDIKALDKRAEAHLETVEELKGLELDLTEFQIEQAERAAKEEERILVARQRRQQAFLDNVFTIFERAFQQRQRLSDAEVELQQFEFQQRESDLRNSLGTREITHREFNVRLNALDAERSRFLQQVEQERASRSKVILADLASIAAEAAKRNIILALTEGSASQIKLAGKTVPFPASLGVFAAIFAAFKLLEKKLLSNAGFRLGGYTGDGNSHEVAGPVHKGEFVFPADVVRGRRKQFEGLLEGMQRGGLEEALYNFGITPDTRYVMGMIKPDSSKPMLTELQASVAQMKAMTLQTERLIHENKMQRRELRELKETLPIMAVTGRKARFYNRTRR